MEAGCSIIKVVPCCTTLHPQVPLTTLLCSCLPHTFLTIASKKSWPGPALVLEQGWWSFDRNYIGFIPNSFLVLGFKVFSFKSWLVDFIIASELLYDNERLAEGASNTSNERPTKCSPELKLVLCWKRLVKGSAPKCFLELDVSERWVLPLKDAIPRCMTQSSLHLKTAVYKVGGKVEPAYFSWNKIYKICKSMASNVWQRGGRTLVFFLLHEIFKICKHNIHCLSFNICAFYRCGHWMWITVWKSLLFYLNFKEKYQKETKALNWRAEDRVISSHKTSTILWEWHADSESILFYVFLMWSLT